MVRIGPDGLVVIPYKTASPDYLVEQDVLYRIINNKERYFPILKETLGANVIIDSLGKKVEQDVWDTSQETKIELNLTTDTKNMIAVWW